MAATAILQSHLILEGEQTMNHLAGAPQTTFDIIS